jgi:hypothetical protein
VDKKTFDIIDLLPSIVFMHRHNESEKVGAPPLASKPLLDQVHERISDIYYSFQKYKYCLYLILFYSFK